MSEDSIPAAPLGETASKGYCIVGLGNPGARYHQTPHNIGFDVLDELAKRHSIRIFKNEGLVTTGAGKYHGSNIVLAKPQTFMNNSGPAVTSLLKSRALNSRNLILIHDEIDLPWTGLRIRKNGSAAGHNGVKSVIAALKTDAFVRVRVGIRPDHEIEDAATYVLAPFERELKENWEEIVSYTADAVESIVAEGAIRAMTKFNRRAQGLKEEEE